MAEVLEGFDFPGRQHRGRKPMYLWDEWLDGRVWKLVQGEDFKCSTQSMRNQLNKAGRKRGVNVRMYSNGHVVIFQAVGHGL